MSKLTSSVRRLSLLSGALLMLLGVTGHAENLKNVGKWTYTCGASESTQQQFSKASNAQCVIDTTDGQPRKVRVMGIDSNGTSTVFQSVDLPADYVMHIDQTNGTVIVYYGDKK